MGSSPIVVNKSAVTTRRAHAPRRPHTLDLTKGCILPVADPAKPIWSWPKIQLHSAPTFPSDGPARIKPDPTAQGTDSNRPAGELITGLDRTRSPLSSDASIQTGRARLSPSNGHVPTKGFGPAPTRTEAHIVRKSPEWLRDGFTEGKDPGDG